MIASPQIAIEPVAESRLPQVSLTNVPFGKYFTDHMLVADYAHGAWAEPAIVPYGNMSLSPGLSALHYGQAIFEGVKAFRLADGSPAIFRPYDNLARFNRSAERLCMPAVPEEIFVDGMKQLVALDSEWIPRETNHSLYIRPFMFATDEAIGVKPSDRYRFMIFLSPTGPYYTAPMRIYVEEHYVRAARGGVGFAKAAGNYAAAMLASAQAKHQGFDQVLWLDAIERKYVQEIGVMNVFFIVDNTALTPSLEDGTILEGVTRASVIALLWQMGLTVEERPIDINEILEAYEQGRLREAFGTGTAVTIAAIQTLQYRHHRLNFAVDNWTVAPALKAKLADIRCGQLPDEYGWMVRV
jgi:branched-chain amino acid aminotransferase